MRVEIPSFLIGLMLSQMSWAASAQVPGSPYDRAHPPSVQVLEGDRAAHVRTDVRAWLDRTLKPVQDGTRPAYGISLSGATRDGRALTRFFHGLAPLAGETDPRWVEVVDSPVYFAFTDRFAERGGGLLRRPTGRNIVILDYGSLGAGSAYPYTNRSTIDFAVNGVRYSSGGSAGFENLEVSGMSGRWDLCATGNSLRKREHCLPDTFVSIERLRAERIESSPARPVDLGFLSAAFADNRIPIGEAFSDIPGYFSDPNAGIPSLASSVDAVADTATIEVRGGRELMAVAEDPACIFYGYYHRPYIGKGAYGYLYDARVTFSLRDLSIAAVETHVRQVVYACERSFSQPNAWPHAPAEVIPRP